jgi:hypothetical protein
MQRLKILAACGAVALMAGGCATPIVAALTVSELMTGASVVSYAATGKGIGEHALDVATGKDCRVIEAALRDDREVCEAHGSKATENDFKGLASIIPPAEAEDIRVSSVQFDVQGR